MNKILHAEVWGQFRLESGGPSWGNVSNEVFNGTVHECIRNNLPKTITIAGPNYASIFLTIFQNTLFVKIKSCRYNVKNATVGELAKRMTKIMQRLEPLIKGECYKIDIADLSIYKSMIAKHTQKDHVAAIVKPKTKQPTTEKTFVFPASKKSRVVNLFAGPGTGKSTTAAALFTVLKRMGCNVELITEYAKDATWEGRGHKIFKAQEYIFGKQHFRLARVAPEVDCCIMDSPVLMCSAYCVPSYLPSLPKVIREAHDMYESINIFLMRTKEYNPSGRSQTFEEAVQKDEEILSMLLKQGVPFFKIPCEGDVENQIIHIMKACDWLKEKAI